MNTIKLSRSEFKDKVFARIIPERQLLKNIQSAAY